MILITTKKLDDPKSVCPPENNFELEKIPKNFKYLNSVTYTNKLNIQINNHILANV
jgi:hypothetical protein